MIEAGCSFVLYRPFSELGTYLGSNAGVWGLVVYVDGRKVGKLQMGERITVHVEPGDDCLQFRQWLGKSGFLTSTLFAAAQDGL